MTVQQQRKRIREAVEVLESFLLELKTYSKVDTNPAFQALYYVQRVAIKAVKH